MQVINHTPFTYLRFSKSDNRGLEFGVLAVKATYAFDDNSQCILSDDQEKINAAEETFGVPNNSSLRQPTDLVGYKPSTDIIINAIAYAPEGKPQKAWNVGVRIKDATGKEIKKTLSVTGPRWWIPKWKRELSNDEKKEWKKHRDLFVGWELSEPEAIDHLPIQYEYAYGGILDKGVDEQNTPIIEAYEYNPVGRGWIDLEWTDHTKPQPAPQIEYADDPIIEPYKQYKPAGYGAIQRAWLPRRPLGGTYDQNWIDTIWPKWPKDYDFAYNNAASEGFSGNGFLTLPITIELVHLHPKMKNHYIRFDDPQLHAAYVNENEPSFASKPNLDTIHLELMEEDDFDNHAFLIWRLIYKTDESERIILALDAPPEDIDIKIPHPDECGIESEALERPHGK